MKNDETKKENHHQEAHNDATLQLRCEDIIMRLKTEPPKQRESMVPLLAT